MTPEDQEALQNLVVAAAKARTSDAALAVIQRLSREHNALQSAARVVRSVLGVPEDRDIGVAAREVAERLREAVGLLGGCRSHDDDEALDAFLAREVEGDGGPIGGAHTNRACPACGQRTVYATHYPRFIHLRCQCGYERSQK
jgi:ribosomal protein S27AE